MEQVSATRSELLAHRARRGRVLLEEKRDHLMSEFRRAADQVLAEADQLDKAAAGGRRALALAEVADGPEAVRSAVIAARVVGRIIEVLDGLTVDDHGKFLTWDGRVHPW